MPLRDIATMEKIDTAPERAWWQLIARWQREAAYVHAHGVYPTWTIPCVQELPHGHSRFESIYHTGIGAVIASLRSDESPITRVLITQELPLED
jgi:hypothetical protein